MRNRKAQDHFAQIVTHPGLQVPIAASRVNNITTERMLREGIEHKPFLEEVVGLFKSCREGGCLLVGHNAIAFDVPMLEMEMQRNGIDFRFGENEVIDTGMLVKASQIGMYFKEQYTLREFSREVHEVRGKIYWGIPSYCYKTYNLGRTGIKLEDAHDAGVDSYLTHLLLESLRALADRQ